MPGSMARGVRRAHHPAKCAPRRDRSRWPLVRGAGRRLPARSRAAGCATRRGAARPARTGDAPRRLLRLLCRGWTAVDRRRACAATRACCWRPCCSIVIHAGGPPDHGCGRRFRSRDGTANARGGRDSGAAVAGPARLSQCRTAPGRISAGCDRPGRDHRGCHRGRPRQPLTGGERLYSRPHRAGASCRADRPKPVRWQGAAPDPVRHQLAIAGSAIAPKPAPS